MVEGKGSCSDVFWRKWVSDQRCQPWAGPRYADQLEDAADHTPPGTEGPPGSAGEAAQPTQGQICTPGMHRGTEWSQREQPGPRGAVPRGSTQAWMTRDDGAGNQTQDEASMPDSMIILWKGTLTTPGRVRRGSSWRGKSESHRKYKRPRGTGQSCPWGGDSGCGNLVQSLSSTSLMGIVIMTPSYLPDVST